MQVYVELPKFTKRLYELYTTADKWLYFLRNARDLTAQPECLQSSMLDKAFEEARVSNLNGKERALYEEAMRNSRDMRNAFISAEELGLQQGKLIGIKEGMARGEESGLAKGKAIGERNQNISSALSGIEMGLSDSQIAKMLDLTIEEVELVRIGQLKPSL